MTVIIITEVSFDRVTTSVAAVGLYFLPMKPKAENSSINQVFLSCCKAKVLIVLANEGEATMSSSSWKQTNKQTNSIILWEHKTVFLTSPQSWQCLVSIIPTCSSGSVYNVLYTVFYKQQGFLNIHILWISHGWQPLAPILFIHPNIIHFDIDLSILLIA